MRTAILFIIITLSLASQAQKNVWTLQQCIDTALSHNLNMKQQQLALKNKQISSKQARQNRLPDLNGSASQSWGVGRSLNGNNSYDFSSISRSTSFGLSAGITLFDGLRMKYNIDQADMNRKMTETEIQKMTNDITMSVLQGYMQILMNKELLMIAQNQLELTQKKYEQQKLLVDLGKLAEGELLDLKAQQAKEEVNRLQAENTLKLSLLDLAQFMNVDNYQELEVKTNEKEENVDLPIPSSELVYSSAINHRPEIKSAEYSLKNSELSMKIARSYYYPTLSFGAGAGTSYYQSNNQNFGIFPDQLNKNLNANFGFSLSIPIFNRFQVKNSVRSAKLNIENEKIGIDKVKIELKKTIEQAYYNALNAKSSWEASKKSEASSKEAYRYVNEKYENGKATLYELYQAKNNLTEAMSNLIQAKYQYIFRVKMLELFQ